MISDRLLSEIVEHARREKPNEACGLVAARDGVALTVYPITNADASSTRYRMHPKEQLQVLQEIDARDWDLAAVYHSHPDTRAYPSETDVELAFYPNCLYIIVSLEDDARPDVRAYRILEGQIREDPLRVAP